MTAAAATVEAKKHGLRQGQDGTWTLALVLHPSDVPNWLLTAPMGQRLALVVAALNEEEEAEKPKERKRFDEMPLSQQAALRGQDFKFWDWLWGEFPLEWADHQEVSDQLTAAAVVRSICLVKSRKEFDSDGQAGARWLDLDARFLSETGRMAEQR